MKMNTKIDKILKVLTPVMMGYFIGYYHTHYKYYKFFKDYS